jgi:hypothetical protein
MLFAALQYFLFYIHCLLQITQDKHDIISSFSVHTQSTVATAGHSSWKSYI